MGSMAGVGIGYPTRQGRRAAGGAAAAIKNVRRHARVRLLLPCPWGLAGGAGSEAAVPHGRGGLTPPQPVLQPGHKNPCMARSSFWKMEVEG